MSELKKQTITIFDESYTIVSDEPEEVLSQAIRYANEIMNALAEKAGLYDKKKIAILSALHLSTELKRLQERMQKIEAQERLLIDKVNMHLEM